MSVISPPKNILTKTTSLSYQEGYPKYSTIQSCFISMVHGKVALHVDLKSNDLDRADSLELIDSYRTVVSITKPAKSSASSSSLTKTLHGNVSSITFSLKVFCADSFYGSTCQQFCEPKDSRYRCSANGTKICESNWYGGNCSVFCSPHSDTQSGQYACDSDGRKICRANWFGTSCTTYCHSGTHHKCNQQGVKVCSPDWYGLDCNQYCKHGVPADGHFQCDVTSGQKVCDKLWYGYDCRTFCEVESSSNFTCHPSSGQKECFDDFYGVGCDVFCRSLTIDNFTCNAVGQKVCKKHFHGKECDIYGRL